MFSNSEVIQAKLHKNEAYTKEKKEREGEGIYVLKIQTQILGT